MGLRFFANSQGIGCTSSATLANVNSCTWLMWFKPESNTTVNGRLLDYRNISSVTVQGIIVYTNGTTPGTNLVRLSFERNHLTTSMIRTSSVGAPIGDWTTVAFTYNGNSAATGTRIFINGTPVGTYQTSQNGVGAPRNTAGNLYIGNRQDGSRVLDGSLKQVVIFNQILSDNLISKWSTSDMATYPQMLVEDGSKVIAHWLYQNDFVDGGLVVGSSTTIDRSGNRNHGSPSTNAPAGVAQQLTYP